MITAQVLFDVVKSHAKEMLLNSNIQFKVVHHPVWCTYDAKQQGLVDPDGAPVIARFEDIEAFRFGNDGEAHHLTQTEMVGV